MDSAEAQELVVARLRAVSGRPIGLYCRRQLIESMDVLLRIGPSLEIGRTESGLYAIKFGDDGCGTVASEIACDSGRSCDRWEAGVATISRELRLIGGEGIDPVE